MLKNLIQRINTYCLCLMTISFLSVSNTSYAHSMVAQHGTLNFIDNHAFLLLSLPVSAFKGIDDDQDGHISLLEFNAHRKTVRTLVEKQVFLTHEQEKLFIEGLLLGPSISHTTKNNHIDQVSVMGRYTLPNIETSVELNIQMFGKREEEKKYEITAKNKKQKLTHQFELTFNSTSIKVFNQ